MENRQKMTDTRNTDVYISVVVPAYNEEQVVEHLYERTAPILSTIDERFEIIFVSDGSKDLTAEKIRRLHLRDPRVKLVELSRNFGKEIALSAGLDFISGDAVVVMDADLQDPPELIPKMVEKWKEGYDVVFTTRIDREGESFVRKTTAKGFYRVIKSLSRVEIPENSGDFRLMSRRVVNALKLLKERHRFMKGLFGWVGFKQIGIPFRGEPRYAGHTKWNYWRLWNFAIEGITSFSYVPLQLSIYVGFLIACLSFLYAGFLTVNTIIYGIDVPGYASIMVAILFFSGIQLMFLGVIGEYLGRLYNETKGRPLYLVQDLVGIYEANDKVFSNKPSPEPRGPE
jgi:glycosyltransferase involved in cell wall biosynthesis